MANRHPIDEEPSADLPPQVLDALRQIASPPRALPALVDARIRAHIDAHAFLPQRRLKGRIAAQWAAAALVAIVSGAALGWFGGGAARVRPAPTAVTGAGSGEAPSGRIASSQPQASPSRTAPPATHRVRPTIVDAMLAARIAGDSLQRSVAAGGPMGPAAIDPALRARLDADSDGSITLDDARLLAAEAVARAPWEDHS